MSSMFWGLRLEPGKRYSTTVDKSFHVSMAALDCASLKSENEILSVMLEEDEANVPYILCNLHKQKAMQSKLDLNFMTGDRVTFFCKGNGVVHLSGYIVPDDDEFSDPVGDDDEELEEECEEEESNEMEILKDSSSTKAKGKMNGIPGSEKRKIDEVSPQGQKKKKIEQAEAAESDDSDDEDSDDYTEELDEIGEESDGIEEEEESEESDEEDESDEEVEVPQATSPQQQKKDKKKQGQQQQTPNVKQSPGKGQKTPNGLSANQQSGKKEKKKGESPANTPKANKSIVEEASPAKKVEGGVGIKDIKIGNGPVCKSGKMASVYYIGRLKSNNKVFDSTQQGPGFKFRVGRGEVIKGWDVGLVGMKVGGKRVITCPPQMAYGQKGSPPTIPSNSTLVFEVELKGVN